MRLDNETRSITFKKCGFNLLNTDDETVEYFGIDNYLCPVEKDFSIYGAYYSDQFRYIELSL